MTDEEFLAYIDHTIEDLNKADISVEMLRSIYNDHEERQADLRDVGEAIQRALTRFSEVHSTRVRIKSSRSLVRKVIRKRVGNPERDINLGNYRDEVRDLIGLRALHLFKENWSPIHKAILDKWDLHPQEKPLAYLREGDSEAIEATLRDAGFDVKKKGGGYRSLHFVIHTQFDKSPCYAEIQVRTLFEEAWGEIDHQVRYPDNEGDILLSDYLLILNRLAGGADEMASLLLRVKATLTELQVTNAQLVEDHARKNEEIKSLQEKNGIYIEQLDISEDEKNELKKQLSETMKLAERKDDPVKKAVSAWSEVLSFTTLPAATAQPTARFAGADPLSEAALHAAAKVLESGAFEQNT